MNSETVNIFIITNAQLIILLRKSVIVSTRENVHEIEQSPNNSGEEEEETMKISLNIQEIENIFTMEEETYVINIHKQFNTHWQGISLGEKFTNETVQFCKDRPRYKLSKEFFWAVDMANKYVSPLLLKNIELTMNGYFQREGFSFHFNSRTNEWPNKSGSAQSVQKEFWKYAYPPSVHLCKP